MTNSYNISFNGGFWIKKPSPEMWSAIKEVMPRRKQILEQLNDDGDKFFAIKTCYDKEMTFKLFNQEIKKGREVEKVDFKFYPDINLKVRIDSYFPEEAKETINAQKRVIENRSSIRKFFAQEPIKQKPIMKYRWKPEDQVAQTLTALKLDKENCNIDIKNGVTKIYDKSNNLIAIASPNSHKGYNYVYEYPTVTKPDARRLVVDYNGAIVHEFGILDSKIFRKFFERNVKIDNGRIRPQ